MRLRILAPDYKEYGRKILEDFRIFAEQEEKFHIAEPNYEGIRINFQDDEVKGWMLIRMSLHDPILPLNFEADREGGVDVMGRKAQAFSGEVYRIKGLRFVQITKIVIDETLKELRAHGTEKFPFQYNREEMQQFDEEKIEWHWHREFEFVKVMYGSVFCLIGNQQIQLEAGEGLFINARVVHSIENCKDGAIAQYLIFLGSDCGGNVGHI